MKNFKKLTKKYFNKNINYKNINLGLEASDIFMSHRLVKRQINLTHQSKKIKAVIN